MWLHAERRGSANAALEGRRPPNVPARTLRLLATYDVAALPGLALQGALAHEGDRLTGLASDVRVPSWTRVDLGARYVHTAGQARLTWRLGVDNAADRRAWKEAPVQFDHVYLYPMAPRTWRVSLQADV
jgi:iron complex outermembrane receptor protein